MSLKVKVCGMTDIHQVNTLIEMKIDFIGFIFYAKSPRFVQGKISAKDVAPISSMSASTVGVFVDEPMEDLMQTINKWKLDYVQLHGHETPAYTEQVSKYCRVIKAFSVGENDNISAMTKDYISAEYFLFDTKGDSRGGTGKKFNWSQLSVPLEKPYFLSGGIGEGDVDQILTFSRNAEKMIAVDINSRFEIEPGLKDMDKIARFTEQIKKYS